MYALDERVGLAGRYSPNARRLVCLAGAGWSFDFASARLAEFCGLAVSDTTVRELSQRAGAAMRVWQREVSAACVPFREASGEVEFATDGASVNTTEGWREMKVGVFSKRERGAPVGPRQWADRTLPAPTARVCLHSPERGAIEKSDRFGTRWAAWCRRLGVRDTADVTLLADGARWIREEGRKHLTHADGVPDVFHALEHVAAAGKALHGETPEATAWTERGRTALLEGGLSGIERHVAGSRTPDLPATATAALDGLENDLIPHEHHLNYAARLAEGRSIGSGQVEGACKNLVGRRLKQTGARWRVQRVNRMAGLCSVMYSDQWNAYWKTLAA